MGDTRPLVHRRSMLFADYPQLVTSLLSLKDDDKIEIQFEDFEHARNFRQRLYTFWERYEDDKKPGLRIKLRDTEEIGVRNWMYITKRIVRKIRVKIYRGTENQFLRKREVGG